MPDDRPNILLFYTDQHRLSALGCYGDTSCRTPNLDRLAEEGVRFETMYTSCPVCSPARATVMTGWHIHTHGVVANVRDIGCNVMELPDGDHLLSRRLAAAGYRCGYTGKWHIGGAPWGEGFGVEHYGIDRLPVALPTTRGFEGQDFPGHGGGGFGYDEYKRYLAEHGWEHKVRPPEREGVRCMGYGILEGPTESTVGHFLAEHTIELIDRFAEAGDPFFIWHNNWGPHSPYYVPQDWYDMYRDVEIPPWPTYEWRPDRAGMPSGVKQHPQADTLGWDEWAEGIRHYYAFASMLDYEIGRVIEHLAAKGLAGNTVVIFTSDHGETLGSHGGLTDKGWHHFEEIQRVGLLVRDPRGFGTVGAAPGTVERRWASAVDLYPTICDLASAKFDADAVHGRSLLPLLRGEDVDWRDTAFVEFCGVNSLATTTITCRHGALKYGWNGNTTDELYDLAADPDETRNLIDDPAYAAAADDMRRRIYTFMRQSRHRAAGMFSNTRLGWWGARSFGKTPDPLNPEDWLVPLRWK